MLLSRGVMGREIEAMALGANEFVVVGRDGEVVGKGLEKKLDHLFVTTSVHPKWGK